MSGLLSIFLILAPQAPAPPAPPPATSAPPPAPAPATSALLGSVPTGTATPGPLPLSLADDLDLKGLYKARAEQRRVEAARWTYQDARELVVLVAGNLYLQALADQSRIDVARAELETARALHRLALDRKASGLVPGIDVLRA